jgi:hypothetical protein
LVFVPALFLDGTNPTSGFASILCSAETGRVLASLLAKVGELLMPRSGGLYGVGFEVV